MMENIYRELGISDKVYRFGKEILNHLKPRFDEIDQKDRKSVM